MLVDPLALLRQFPLLRLVPVSVSDLEPFRNVRVLYMLVLARVHPFLQFPRLEDFLLRNSPVLGFLLSLAIEHVIAVLDVLTTVRLFVASLFVLILSLHRCLLYPGRLLLLLFLPDVHLRQREQVFYIVPLEPLPLFLPPLLSLLLLDQGDVLLVVLKVADLVEFPLFLAHVLVFRVLHHEVVDLVPVLVHVQVLVVFLFRRTLSIVHLLIDYRLVKHDIHIL